jgi:4-aminobutyrate aminotransferase
VISPSYTRSYPLVVERGEGATIIDVDGNRFLDCTAGIAVVATGHCHPRVVKAIQEQAAKLIHMSGTDFYYENMVQLAEKLSAISPGGVPRRVYFGNSGTEAIEAAIKLARYHTGRDKFIAFLGAFHGRTMGALSLTASKVTQKRKFGPGIPGVTHIPYANCRRCAYGKTVETCGVECVRVLEDLIFKTAVPPEEVAAIFVEPVQGEGGYIVPPQKFFDELSAVCSRHDILLICDEVQSGMGRTGRMWACGHFGLTPDVLTVAKGIASGMPLGATIAKAEWMTWKAGAHASTFGGNPVSVAAALATIELLEEELVANAALVGGHMMDSMRDWPKRFPRVAQVRGLGLMIGVELEARELRDAAVERAFERGLLLLGAGESTIRLSPPLVITRDQGAFAVETLAEIIAGLAGTV